MKPHHKLILGVSLFLVLILGGCVYRIMEACDWDEKNKKAAGLQPGCEYKRK